MEVLEPSIDVLYFLLDSEHLAVVHVGLEVFLFLVDGYDHVGGFSKLVKLKEYLGRGLT